MTTMVFFPSDIFHYQFVNKGQGTAFSGEYVSIKFVNNTCRLRFMHHLQILSYIKMLNRRQSRVPVNSFNVVCPEA